MTDAQLEGERFYSAAIANMEALRALMRRKNAAMVRVAVLVGELQRAGRLTAADGQAFDALFAEYGPAEEGPLSARWNAMIEQAKATRITVTKN